MDRMLGLCSKNEENPVPVPAGDSLTNRSDSNNSSDSTCDTENTKMTWGDNSFESASSGIGESISSRIPILDCPEWIIISVKVLLL